jgi:hypothetical protein
MGRIFITVFLAVLFAWLPRVCAETAPVAEGFSPAEPAPPAGTADFRINISEASAGYSGGEYRVTAAGTTDLPDGARIYVFLKKGEFPISCKVVRAVSGRFSAVMGPFQAKLPVGIYTLEAALLMPEQNIERVRKILSGSDTSMTKGIYQLAVGRPEDVAKEEESGRIALEEAAGAIEGMLSELEEKYACYGRDLNDEEWKTWYAGWTGRLRQRQQEIDNNVKPLFARDYSSPAAVSYASMNLEQLGRVYSSQLRGSPLKDVYPQAFRDPVQLKSLIADGLGKIYPKKAKKLY